MNAEQVATLRMLLAPTGWLDRAAEFARVLHGSARTQGGLLLVGTPDHEPWHFAAHLDDESRLAGLPELAPTLVRWNPPPGAPAHLSVSLPARQQRRGTPLPPARIPLGRSVPASPLWLRLCHERAFRTCGPQPHARVRQRPRAGRRRAP